MVRQSRAHGIDLNVSGVKKNQELDIWVVGAEDRVAAIMHPFADKNWTAFSSEKKLEHFIAQNPKNGSRPVLIIDAGERDIKKIGEWVTKIAPLVMPSDFIIVHDSLDYKQIIQGYEAALDCILTTASPLYDVSVSARVEHWQAKDVIGNCFKLDAELITKRVTSTKDITAIIEEMPDFLRKKQASREILENVPLVMDELLMNALFGAPVDENNQFKYHMVDRKKDLILLPNEYVHLTYGCARDICLVHVSDNFGSLTRGRLKETFTRMSNASTLGSDHSSTGAGLGLYYILRNSHGLKIDIFPGNRCDIVALFFMKRHGRMQHGDKNFSFFIG